MSGWPTRSLIALAALSLVLAGCTLPGWRPVADQGAAPAPAGTVVQFVNDGESGTPTGLRVLPDGRVEELRDGSWGEVWRYDDAALDDLRQDVAKADQGLDDRYEPPGGGSGKSRTTWQLAQDDGGVHTVVVEGPQAPPPPLQRLFRRMFELRPQPAASSLWRVRVGDELVERHVDGEPAGVKAIAPLVDALFAPAGEPGDELPDDPDAPLLVEIAWTADGTLTETTRVYADGRNASVKGGAEEERRRYTADEVRAIEAAVEQVGWASLPDPLSPG